tara:strand:- start:1355 stop:1945 length:591 start_codon:yes stop_codon:yes gene_type:complete
MTGGAVLQQLPNSLTFLRLLLAVPLGICILREAYPLALLVGLAAGVSDGLDGFFARRLQAQSRLGAILDPVADKTLITVSFLCFAAVELVPWYLAIIVILRDLVIIAGAISYRLIFGPFEFAATALSKGNMFVQISFCLLVLLAQVVADIPPWSLVAGAQLVIFLTVVSGVDYVWRWTVRALQTNKRTGQHPRRRE